MSVVRKALAFHKNGASVFSQPVRHRHHCRESYHAEGQLTQSLSYRLFGSLKQGKLPMFSSGMPCPKPSVAKNVASWGLQTGMRMVPGARISLSQRSLKSSLLMGLIPPIVPSMIFNLPERSHVLTALIMS
jgi:hypothetical protein